MLHQRSIREKLLKGGAWAFGGRIAVMLTALASNALLARLLSPQDLAAYLLTVSLVSIMVTVAQLGLTQTIVRFVADSLGRDMPGKARRSVVLVMRTVAISGVIVAGFLGFGAGHWIAMHWFHSVAMAQVMGLASAWVIIMLFQNMIAETCRGFHDIRLATIFGGLLTSILSMLAFLVLWLLQGHEDLTRIVGISIGAGLGSVLISSAVLWNILGKLPPAPDSIRLAEILHITWPIWLTSLTLFVLVQADLWIMGLFRPAGEVAIYGLAAKVGGLLAAPLLIVNAVVPPMISEMYAQGRTRELEGVLRAMAALSGLPAALVLAVVALFGATILGHLFGDHYRAGGLILLIICTGQFVNVWAGSCGLVLMLTGHQITMMLISIFCGLFSVIMAWALVSSHGGTGVAIASSSGMILQNLLMLYFARSRVGLWTYASPMRLRAIGKLLR